VYELSREAVVLTFHHRFGRFAIRFDHGPDGKPRVWITGGSLRRGPVELPPDVALKLGALIDEMVALMDDVVCGLDDEELR
jgi:hypothetical protein